MLYFWFTLFLLHSLSRVVPAYPAIVAIATGLALLAHLRARYEKDQIAMILATISMTTYVLIVDVVQEGVWPSLGNMVRLLTPMAAMLLILLVDLNDHALRRLGLVFLSVVWLAALSIFYQVANGAISWFADPSERAGVERFASLLGSLTTFGTAAPVAVLCVAMFARSTAAVLLFAVPLLAAGVMSLQKAALAGFLVSAPFLFALLSRKALLALALGFVAMLAGAIAFIPSSIVDYAMVGWKYFGDPASGNDVGLAESIVSRLTEYPRELIGRHGLTAMIFGVGLRGGSGVFGFTDEPMAHNGIVDYLAIGGVFYLAYGLSLLAVVILSAARVHRWQSNTLGGRRETCFIVGLTVLYVANLPFASGLGFHPAFCWIPPAIIAFSAARRRRRAGPFLSNSLPLRTVTRS